MKTHSGYSMQEHIPNITFSHSAIEPLVLPTQDPSDESDKESETDSLPAILEGNVKSDMTPSQDDGEGKENIPIQPTLPTIFAGDLKEIHHDNIVKPNENMENKVVTNQLIKLENRKQNEMSLQI